MPTYRVTLAPWNRSDAKTWLADVLGKLQCADPQVLATIEAVDETRARAAVCLAGFQPLTAELVESGRPPAADAETGELPPTLSPAAPFFSVDARIRGQALIAAEAFFNRFGNDRYEGLLMMYEAQGWTEAYIVSLGARLREWLRHPGREADLPFTDEEMNDILDAAYVAAANEYGSNSWRSRLLKQTELQESELEPLMAEISRVLIPVRKVQGYIPDEAPASAVPTGA